MGAPTLAHFPPTKAGYLSHDLTDLPRHDLSFPHCPIATLRVPTQGFKLEAPPRQAKILPIQTHSLLSRIVLPILVPQLKMLH
jgi:hypothetical protein